MSVNKYNKTSDSLTRLASNLYSNDEFEELEKKVDKLGNGTWVGTQAEWDALDKSTLEDKTVINITDDYDNQYAEVDDALSSTSEHPVQNKVINSEISSIKSDLSNKIATVEYEVNESITNSENGLYYKLVDVTDQLPTNAVLINAIPSPSGYDGGVIVSAMSKKCILLQSTKSLTFNRKILLVYVQ